MNKLRITEIFHSIQGESTTVGLPTVFVRLTGCPLRCGYCDTAYAFHGGALITMAEVMAQIAELNCKRVTVTGGEPLAQPLCLDLMRELCDQGYQVSLETSGALDISKVDPRVMKVMDLKTPGSHYVKSNRYENIEHLSSDDQIKFVICDQADYTWSKQIINQYQLEKKCQLLFSPAHGELENQQLAEWILQDSLPVRMQVQLHKYIWGDVAGR